MTFFRLKTRKASLSFAKSRPLRFFVLGFLIRSSNKKRPDNLIFGRLHDHKVLDQFETQITAIEGNFEEAFKQIDLTQRAILVVFGDVFETKPELGRIRNFFTDMFGSNNQKTKIDIEYSLGFVITLTGFEDGSLELRFHKYSKAQGALVDLGVKLRMRLGRTKLATDEVFKEACKQPKLEKKTALKKVSEKSGTGEHLARVHVRQQDLKTLRLKKIKKQAPTGKTSKKDKRKQYKGQVSDA